MSERHPKKTRRIDLAQTVTILANIGVIAGIVFLTFELRQNNAQLASQFRTSFYAMRSELESDFIRNSGGIADSLQTTRTPRPGKSSSRKRSPRGGARLG